MGSYKKVESSIKDLKRKLVELQQRKEIEILSEKKAEELDRQIQQLEEAIEQRGWELESIELMRNKRTKKLLII